MIYSVLFLCLLVAGSITFWSRKFRRPGSADNSRGRRTSPAAPKGRASRSVYDETLREEVPLEFLNVLSSLTPGDSAEGDGIEPRREISAEVEARARELLKNVDCESVEPEWASSQPLNVRIRERIVTDWGKHLEFEHIGGSIRDTKVLPHPKETILRAICEQILVEHDEDRLFRALIPSAARLADYQDGVGDEPLWGAGFDSRILLAPEFAKLSTDEKFQRINAATSDGNAERYKAFEPQMWADVGRISSLVEAANRRRSAKRSRE